MHQDSTRSPKKSNRISQKSAGSRFKVPYGLKDGRMWSPSMVPNGKACGCICPACRAPLVAKATQSERRRPHFAHAAETDCQAGYETALHLKAKQLIADRRRIWLPRWDGEIDMPNPPSGTDIAGYLVAGRRVEFPAREVSLGDVRLEESRGDYIPDVIAVDNHGELLIEVKVTHAVSEEKRRRIQSEGLRLMEIDLSGLRPQEGFDEELFARYVLDDVSNRAWLSCPLATEDWRASTRELKQTLAERNLEIERQRSQAEARRAQLADDRELRNLRRERAKAKQRVPLQRQLDALASLVAPERVKALLNTRWERDRTTAEELIIEISVQRVKQTLLVHHSDAWIYGVHPVLWQVATYRHFIHEKPAGTRFNQREVARWVRMRFGCDTDLYDLFRAQYAARADARRAGYYKNRISNWVFSEAENQLIPNFYIPINDLVNRLVLAGALMHNLSVLGEVFVATAT